MIHYRHQLLSGAAAVIVLYLVSCGPKQPEQPVKVSEKEPFSAAAWLAKDTIGFFRGAEFGDEEATIRQMENDSFLVFNSPSLLKYEYQLPGERHYQLEYTFKKNKLSSFNFDIFLPGEHEAESLTTDLKKWFEKRFGEGVSEMGAYVWPMPKSQEFKESYLELKDESAEFGYGKVNISAYAIR